MNLFTKIASLGIGEVSKALGSLAKDLRTAILGELPPDKRVEFETIMVNLEAKLSELETKDKEIQASVIIAEAKGESWLQKNWRPLLMAMFGAIIANNYIMFPYIQLFFGPEFAIQLVIPPDMWGLLKLGVSGYIVGRSAEKIAEGDGLKSVLGKVFGGNGIDKK